MITELNRFTQSRSIERVIYPIGRMLAVGALAWMLAGCPGDTSGSHGNTVNGNLATPIPSSVTESFSIPCKNQLTPNELENVVAFLSSLKNAERPPGEDFMGEAAEHQCEYYGHPSRDQQ